MTRNARSSLPTFVVAALLAASAAPADAQLIGLKTVPLAAGEQFLIFPSRNLGMGGTSLALRDDLADPYSNPAWGANTESRVVSVPTFYSVTNENGGARTMPIGVQLRRDVWFGGMLVALQDLEMGRGLRNWLPPIDGPLEVALPRTDAMAIHTSTNRFAHLSIGRTIGDDWAIGASAMFAGLNGTDGVEQLFANAWEIYEDGGVKDFRLGVTRAFGEETTLEVALVHNRFRVAHDVTTVLFELTDSANWLFTPTVEQEEHKNISHTWGGLVGLTTPLEEGSGWTAGLSLTTNYKNHPKIPTYDLTAVGLPERPVIPRDPGNSWAFAFGAGLAYEEGPTTFAVDVVYEPAVSDTWADQPVDVTAADGSIIPAGGHTVDNHFEFNNSRANVGLSQVFTDRITGMLGVRMRSYSYRMEQQDYVLGLDRDLVEDWTEWTPTWGGSFALGNVTLNYTGLASSATHFPFPEFGGGREIFDVASPDLQGGDILAPPSGRLGAPDETVVTHRLQLSVPIR